MSRAAWWTVVVGQAENYGAALLFGLGAWGAIAVLAPAFRDGGGLALGVVPLLLAAFASWRVRDGVLMARVLESGEVFAGHVISRRETTNRQTLRHERLEPLLVVGYDGPDGRQRTLEVRGALKVGAPVHVIVDSRWPGHPVLPEVLPNLPLKIADDGISAPTSIYRYALRWAVFWLLAGAFLGAEMWFVVTHSPPRR